MIVVINSLFIIISVTFSIILLRYWEILQYISISNFNRIKM